MKAITITQPGAPEVLQLSDTQKPAPGVGQVLIKVAAAGVNRPDVAQRKGRYPAPPNAPQNIPGLEVSGFIEACGKGVVHCKPGDAVCALLPGGGYAQYAVAHQHHCLPVPAGVDMVAAAALPETIFTVWHNVFERGRLQPGESLLVHGGTSGIGTMAIQLARAWGSRVFATAGSDEKCAACRTLGADMAINYRTQDFGVALQGNGVDVILDMVGADYVDRNLALLNNDGRLVYINAVTGGKLQVNALAIMQRRLTITGSTLRSREDNFKTALATAVHRHVWPLIEAGKVRPVIHAVFALEQAAQAHTLMESSSHIGKIVLRVG